MDNLMFYPEISEYPAQSHASEIDAGNVKDR